MATQADIDALYAALARTEMEVRFADGRMVKYRTVAEIEQAISAIQRQISTDNYDRTTYVEVGPY